MTNLGQLQEIKELRTVWPHEALDFTPWLAEDDNISLLADAVGLEITIDETESSVGDFNVDIFATETGTDRKIIIENQIEETDHKHLGQLITYASGKSADVIIWVVKHAREEHKAAIEWLNNHTDDKIGFFLCEIKLYKIDNSQPAVKFEVIEKPNGWAKKLKQNKNISPMQQQIYDFWVKFNDHAFKNPQFKNNFRQLTPSTDNWMSFSIGSSDYCLRITQVPSRNELILELNIINNKKLFNSLYEHKDDIEKITEFPLDWREMPENKSSRIMVTKEAVLADESKWTEQFDWIMDSMIKMKKAFKKYL